MNKGARVADGCVLKETYSVKNVTEGLFQLQSSATSD